MRRILTRVAILQAFFVGVLFVGYPGVSTSGIAETSTEASDPSRAETPDFLADLPQLKGVSLNISEKAFRNLLADRKLPYKRTVGNGQTTYEVRVPGKEFDAIVIFGFQNGSCSGIQRMPPDLKR